MKPEFWLERWQRGEIGWHQDEINTHLVEFWPGLDLSAETRVFVPLCGKTLDLVWLMSLGHRVLGVEISETAAEQVFAEHGLTPRISERPPFRQYEVDELVLLRGDFFDLTPDLLEGVGAVFDRASLIALPPEMRLDYVRHLKELLPRPVPTLLITLDYEQTQMAGPPFSVHPEEVRRLLDDRYRITELACFDALDDSPNFRKRGLTALSERIYRLEPKGQTT